jgi:hypothetical protein
MAIFSARERLTRLVELAGQEGFEARRALAGELADLLLAWPSIYPRGMREPFEALLEKTMRDIGPAERAALADRFVADEDMPLSILNLLVFDAGPETRDAILLRNGSEREPSAMIVRIPVNEAALLAAARGTASDGLPAVLAVRLGIPLEIAQAVLADSSATMLAVLCKGANLRRQTFSGLAVIAKSDASAETSYGRLAAFDDISETGARALLAVWREEVRPTARESEAA